MESLMKHSNIKILAENPDSLEDCMQGKRFVSISFILTPGFVTNFRITLI